MFIISKAQESFEGLAGTAWRCAKSWACSKIVTRSASFLSWTSKPVRFMGFPWISIDFHCVKLSKGCHKALLRALWLASSSLLHWKVIHTFASSGHSK